MERVDRVVRLAGKKGADTHRQTDRQTFYSIIILDDLVHILNYWLMKLLALVEFILNVHIEG